MESVPTKVCPAWIARYQAEPFHVVPSMCPCFAPFNPLQDLLESELVLTARIINKLGGLMSASPQHSLLAR